MPLFAMIGGRGAGWRDGVPMAAQDGWTDHAAFMNGLEARGAVKLAGPWGSERRVLIVVEANSADEARALFDADPWALSGHLLIDEVAEWDLKMGRVD